MEPDRRPSTPPPRCTPLWLRPHRFGGPHRARPSLARPYRMPSALVAEPGRARWDRRRRRTSAAKMHAMVELARRHVLVDRPRTRRTAHGSRRALPHPAGRGSPWEARLRTHRPSRRTARYDGSRRRAPGHLRLRARGVMATFQAWCQDERIADRLVPLHIAPPSRSSSRASTPPAPQDPATR